MDRRKDVWIYPLLFLTLVVVAGCTQVISKQSDEEAWKDFQKEIHPTRAPSSVDLLGQELAKVPVRNLLLACQGSESMQLCYQEKLSFAFDESFRKAQKIKPDLNEQIYKKEQKKFLSDRSFDAVFAEVQSFHQRLLSGLDLRAIEHAKTLNAACDQRYPSDSEIHSYYPYNGGTTDMPKGQLRCLNEAWLDDMDQLLKETSERLGVNITSKEAKAWIKKYQISPVYVQETQIFMKKKAEEEMRRWQELAVNRIREKALDQDLEGFVKHWALELRQEYPHLALESLLTEVYQSSRKPAGETRQ